MADIAPEGDPLYTFSDNTKYRGTWDTWLRDTVLSENIDQRQHIARSIRNFTIKAFCMSCRNHAKEYVSQNPPENATLTVESMFSYIGTFMNHVQENKRKSGKNAKLYNLDILWKVYNGSNGVCTDQCDGSTKSHTREYTKSENQPVTSNQFKISSVNLYHNNRRTGRIQLRSNDYI